MNLNDKRVRTDLILETYNWYLRSKLLHDKRFRMYDIDLGYVMWSGIVDAPFSCYYVGFAPICFTL